MFRPKSAKSAETVFAQPNRGALTYIGAGSELQGDLHAGGDLRVDGTVRGNVTVDGDLEVAASGMIEGERVIARNVLVQGRVKAAVQAAEQLRIHGQGRLEGDVAALSLDIESGAQFIGFSRTGARQDMQEAQILQLERAALVESRS